MSRPTATALAVLALAAATVQAPAQTRRTAPPKKQPAPPRAVLGTAQLPGDNGKVNQAYTMGADAPYPLNFTLLKAEYGVGRLLMGRSVFTPKRDEKLLLLRFTIQNPNKNQDLLVRHDSVVITAIDSKDVNHVWLRGIARAGETKDTFTAMLKPAQKVELVGGVLVPADVSVPKLMVERYPSKRVLRYDLHGIVRPLEAPYADPNDATGACALADIPGAASTYYAAERFDVQFKSAAVVDAVGAVRPRKRGDKILVATLGFRNASNDPWLLRFDTFAGSVTTADGDRLERTQGLYNAGRDERFSRTMEPGEEATARLLVDVPANVALTKLAVWQGQSHRIVFDLGGLK